MKIVLLILILAFVGISIVSFVFGNMLDKRMKQNKDDWFSNHSEEECKIVSDYLAATREKRSKVKKNGKEKKSKN